MQSANSKSLGMNSCFRPVTNEASTTYHFRQLRRRIPSRQRLTERDEPQ